MTTTAAVPTSLVGSYAQPDWLIDREKLRGRFPPRVRATRAVAGRPGYLERGPGRRDAARDPRPGARGARHHHRRRDAPRELLEPLRDRARRRRRRQPGHGARPQRPPEPGAARRRPGPPPPPRPGARRAVPAGPHEPRRSRSPCPGPFTMSQQAQDDHYGDPAALGYGVRRRGPRGDRRPVRRRRRHRPDRRAVHAGPSRAGPRVRPGRARAARSTASAGTTALHICFGYAAIIHERPEAYSFLPELAASAVDQISIETAQSELDLGGARRRCRARRSSSACSTSTTRRSRRRRPSPSASAARCPTSDADRAGRRAGLRHEVPPPRRRLRQARGARGRGDGALHRLITRSAAPGG